MSLLLAQSALPAPETIRDTAQEVVSRPYYRLESSSSSNSTPWILELLRWILKPFVWLFENTEGLPEFLRWVIVIAFAILCIALLAHILYTLIKAIGNPSLGGKHALTSASGREIDPKEFERQAADASAGGDYIGAVRLLFRAALRRLELFEQKKFRPGITNRELVNRYRKTPLAESMQQFVSTIEMKWYGQMPCIEADYVTCRTEHGRICQYIQGARPADRA
jgi:hypothetical protein